MQRSSGRGQASVHVRLSFSLPMGKGGKVIIRTECFLEPVLKWPAPTQCVHSRCLQSVSQGWGGCTSLLPETGQDSQIGSHSSSLGMVPSSLAATSGLITFLLDSCPSCAQPPSYHPLCPEGASQPTHSIPSLPCWSGGGPRFRTGPAAPSGLTSAPSWCACALGAASVSSSVRLVSGRIR